MKDNEENQRGNTTGTGDQNKTASNEQPTDQKESLAINNEIQTSSKSSQDVDLKEEPRQNGIKEQDQSHLDKEKKEDKNNEVNQPAGSKITSDSIQVGNSVEYTTSSNTQDREQTEKTPEQTQTISQLSEENQSEVSQTEGNKSSTVQTLDENQNRIKEPTKDTPRESENREDTSVKNRDSTEPEQSNKRQSVETQTESQQYEQNLQASVDHRNTQQSLGDSQQEQKNNNTLNSTTPTIYAENEYVSSVRDDRGETSFQSYRESNRTTNNLSRISERSAGSYYQNQRGESLQRYPVDGQSFRMVSYQPRSRYLSQRNRSLSRQQPYDSFQSGNYPDSWQGSQISETRYLSRDEQLESQSHGRRNSYRTGYSPDYNQRFGTYTSQQYTTDPFSDREYGTTQYDRPPSQIDAHTCSAGESCIYRNNNIRGCNRSEQRYDSRDESIEVAPSMTRETQPSFDQDTQINRQSAPRLNPNLSKSKPRNSEPKVLEHIDKQPVFQGKRQSNVRQSRVSQRSRLSTGRAPSTRGRPTTLQANKSRVSQDRKNRTSQEYKSRSSQESKYSAPQDTRIPQNKSRSKPFKPPPVVYIFGREYRQVEEPKEANGSECCQKEHTHETPLLSDDHGARTQTFSTEVASQSSYKGCEASETQNNLAASEGQETARQTVNAEMNTEAIAGKKASKPHSCHAISDSQEAPIQSVNEDVASKESQKNYQAPESRSCPKISASKEAPTETVNANVAPEASPGGQNDSKPRSCHALSGGQEAHIQTVNEDVAPKESKKSRLAPESRSCPAISASKLAPIETVNSDVATEAIPGGQKDPKPRSCHALSGGQEAHIQTVNEDVAPKESQKSYQSSESRSCLAISPRKEAPTVIAPSSNTIATEQSLEQRKENPDEAASTLQHHAEPESQGIKHNDRECCHDTSQHRKIEDRRPDRSKEVNPQGSYDRRELRTYEHRPRDYRDNREPYDHRRDYRSPYDRQDPRYYDRRDPRYYDRRDPRYYGRPRYHDYKRDNRSQQGRSDPRQYHHARNYGAPRNPRTQGYHDSRSPNDREYKPTHENVSRQPHDDRTPNDRSQTKTIMPPSDQEGRPTKGKPLPAHGSKSSQSQGSRSLRGKESGASLRKGGKPDQGKSPRGQLGPTQESKPQQDQEIKSSSSKKSGPTPKKQSGQRKTKGDGKASDKSKKKDESQNPENEKLKKQENSDSSGGSSSSLGSEGPYLQRRGSVPVDELVDPLPDDEHSVDPRSEEATKDCPPPAEDTDYPRIDSRKAVNPRDRPYKPPVDPRSVRPLEYDPYYRGEVPEEKRPLTRKEKEREKRTQEMLDKEEQLRKEREEEKNRPRRY